MDYNTCGNICDINNCFRNIIYGIMIQKKGALNKNLLFLYYKELKYCKL